ncbi:MAG: histidinol-phosphate transaminase [Bacteroidales bacterium]|nr:histidinol-phosphate transaminase [Bacteroidales bacterium]MDD3906715.1 histidinol-phosphate transaminase [Bacteroidales bacterium]MDD4713674.1 histidinol-phosphate transaminase [Bacteroidales bacterium]
MNLQNLVRPNIFNLKPYSCARDEFKGKASAYLDANENPLNAPYNRYPDPLQNDLKEKVAKLKNMDSEKLFFGNGSDEPIDLVIRIFCEPGVDNIVAIDPTYGMYQVCADINNVEYRKVHLLEDFSLDVDSVLAAVDDRTKIIFMCSPNNPTGNDLNVSDMKKVIKSFNGIVVIDEAYIDFSSRKSFLTELDQYPNLIVLQTFSKAWGMAAIRLGMAFAGSEIIGFFNKVKYPYNINLLTQYFVGEEIKKLKRKEDWVEMLVSQRGKLIAQLEKLPMVQKVYPTDANFVLVKVNDANATYRNLVEQGIIVRNRNNVSLCLGCLRITVGIPEENTLLIDTLQKMK